MGDAISKCTEGKDEGDMDMSKLKEGSGPKRAAGAPPTDITESPDVAAALKLLQEQVAKLTNDNQSFKAGLDKANNKLKSAEKEIKGYKKTIKEYTVKEHKAKGTNMKETQVVVQEMTEEDLRLLEAETQKPDATASQLDAAVSEAAASAPEEPVQFKGSPKKEEEKKDESAEPVPEITVSPSSPEKVAPAKSHQSLSPKEGMTPEREPSIKSHHLPQDVSMENDSPEAPNELSPEIQASPPLAGGDDELSPDIFAQQKKATTVVAETEQLEKEQHETAKSAEGD